MRKKVLKELFLCKDVLIKCFLTFIMLSLTIGTQAYCQIDKKTSITIQNSSAKAALEELQRTTKLHFVYEQEVISSVPNVTLMHQNVLLSEILNDFCRQTSLKYEVLRDRILILPPNARQNVEFVTLKGKVTDTGKEPLAGVAVFLKNTNFGTFTNLEGDYSLRIPKETGRNAMIVFTLLTFERQEIPYQQHDVINTIMKESISELNEVVVTGYQNINRKDMVGAYATLKMDDIKMPNYSSVDQMLQGQVAGMIVTSESNRAGTSPKISIRGTSTLIGNSEPLWVVDGVTVDDVPQLNGTTAMLTATNNMDVQINDFIGSQIAWLNPNDIETVTILKDASATAIYGSRASNGVIVITTKKGKKDRSSISYSANMSISSRPTYDDYYLMNSQERVNFSKQAFDAGAYYLNAPIMQPYTYEGATSMYLNGKYTEEEYIKQYNYLETINTDWLKLLTRSSVSHQHNLSINGGSEKVVYSVSLSYNNTEGTEKGNDMERYSGRLRLGFDLSSKLKLDISMTGTVSKTNTFAGIISPLSYALSTSRAVPAFNEQGDPVYYKVSGNYPLNPSTNNNLTFNAQNEIANSYSKLKTPQLNANATLKWEILPEVGYELVVGYQNSDRSSSVYAGENTHYVIKNYRGYEQGSYISTDPEFKAAMLPFGGEYSTENISSKSYNMQHKLTYSKTINKDHRFNALGAFELRSVHTRGKFNTVFGYMPERGETLARPTPLDELTPVGGGTVPTGWGILNRIYSGGWSSTNQKNNYISAFATLAYAYKGRYVINANFRHDASNRFGQSTNNRFDPTLSLGVAWTLSEEPFFKQYTQEYVDFLKLRLTYGSQGNVLTNHGPDLLLQTSKASTYYGVYYSKVVRLENQLLDWERTYSWNAGLDVTLFKGIVTASFEYYLRQSDPASNGVLPAEYGGLNESVPIMGSQINNEGIEGTINITPIRSKDWTVITGINLSRNWNTVKKIVTNSLNNITTANYLSGQTTKVLEKDYPVGAFWAYSFKGLDPETGYPLFNYLDGENGTKQTDFLVYAGNKNPHITGGINFNIRYKSFGLVSHFAAVLGGKTFLSNPYSSFAGGKVPSEFLNLSKELTKRWRTQGDENHTNIPGVLVHSQDIIHISDPSGYETNDSYLAWAVSDARIVSKSFLRCRQLGLNWYVPQKLLRYVSAQSATLSATANNLFVLASSKYNGLDPELQTAKMPMTFSFGLNISF